MYNERIKYLCKIALITAFLMAAAAIFAEVTLAGEATKRLAEYSITIDGYDVGKSHQTWAKRGEKEVALLSTENLGVPGFDYAVETEFLWNADALTSFMALEKENDKKATVNGAVKADAFVITEKNGSKDKELASFKTSEFDVVYEALPVYLANKDFPESIEVRVLDMFTGDIQTGKVTNAGKEKLSVGKTAFECTKVDYKTGDGSATLWIAKDAFGHFVVKEVSTSELGNATLEMKKHTIKQ